ncbi:MAG: hypothetical protein ABIT01_02025 [Thermoanaerobaculia bacterium]
MNNNATNKKREDQMNTNKTTKIVPFRSPETTTIVSAGGNRGFLGQLPAYAAIAKRSASLVPDVLIVDPLPGRANARVGDAERAGLHARGEEMTIQRFLESRRTAPRLLDLHIDNPAAIRDAVAMTVNENTIITGGLFVRFPTGDCLALDWVYRPEETEGRRGLADLSNHLDHDRLPNGYSDVFGGIYASEAMTEERMARNDWMKRADVNVERVLTGLPQEGHNLEARWNGDRMPARIVNNALRFADEPELMAKVSKDWRTLARGSRFLVLELGPEHGIKALVGEIGFEEKTLTLVQTREVGRDGRPIPVIDARPIRRQNVAAGPERMALASPSSAVGTTD